MPANKQRDPASDRKAVVVFRQNMLNTNSNSNGIKIGYIASLIWGLIAVKKVIKNCRIMTEARTTKVVAVQNSFLLRNHLWTLSINKPLSWLIFGLTCFFTNQYRVYTSSLNYLFLRASIYHMTNQVMLTKNTNLWYDHHD